ncbi:hypothetical protein [Tessaracoccus sp. SD287]|uniref:hypothetical protein n=1 Tax=Tessaracoccus sp. SD287 TaxID=2782008 RepID=UPI001A95E791|nr:hypothetical protein [Tessaracoccus sp. SD287]
MTLTRNPELSPLAVAQIRATELPARGGAVAVEHETVELAPRRLRRAKKAYTVRAFARQTRENGAEGYHLERGSSIQPQPGDLVLARVAEVGQHKRLESYNSRRRHLFVGDEIVVAYGHRYAPDQFLAEVPDSLDFTNLVAAGGLAGRVIDRHADIDPATVIEPIGLLADEQGVINLRRTSPARVRPWQQARDEFAALAAKPHVVVVFGSSMNSGKSTVVGSLVNGLGRAGFEVSAGKATGTGAGNDSGLFHDAGANLVLDFTDFGLPSTFKLTLAELKDTVFSVFAELAGNGDDVIVVEIADGIYQGETAHLITDPDFKAMVDSVLFACGEALSAAAGSELLTRAQLPLKAISGRLTSAPLITREAQAVTAAPVIGTFDLCIGEVARSVIGL